MSFNKLFGLVSFCSNRSLCVTYMFCLQDCTGIIDFREYLLGVLVISKASNEAEMMELAFKVMYYSRPSFLAVCNVMTHWHQFS